MALEFLPIENRPVQIALNTNVNTKAKIIFLIIEIHLSLKNSSKLRLQEYEWQPPCQRNITVSQ